MVDDWKVAPCQSRWSLQGLQYPNIRSFQQTAARLLHSLLALNHVETTESHAK